VEHAHSHHLKCTLTQHEIKWKSIFQTLREEKDKSDKLVRDEKIKADKLIEMVSTSSKES